MRSFELQVCFPGGGPSIGGAATLPYGFHASHAELPDGKPYLPATALRGALRDSLEALLRGTGQGACEGGTGTDPDLATSDAETERGADRRCFLGDDGGPCIACRVFGGGRSKIEKDERAFSALVLGDAMLVGAHQWLARPSVAVSRSSRSAADKQLVLRRIPDGSDGKLTFTACGRLNDAVLETYLEAAVRATTHVGASRSRGLAHVEIAIAWQDASPARAPSSSLERDSSWLGEASAPAGTASLPLGRSEELRLRVTLTSPALVGASVIDGNYRETRHEIPGSTVRGAIGFALRELVDDADHDTAAQDLLDPERGARFGFLYPADLAPGADADRISGPLPITAAWCKTRQREHGVVDTLIDRLALLHAASAAEAERAAPRSGGTTCRHAGCDQPLRGAHGSRRASRKVDTRTIVRVAMDRARQSARDGQLFSQVLLAPGITFEGTVRGIPPQSRARLAQALDSGIVSFGRGRSAGWGRARIEVEPARALPSIAKRAEAFDRALRGRLAAAGLTSERVGRLVPVTLISPLWPSGGARDPGDCDDRADDGGDDLCAATGAARCFLAARRFARDGTWDQRTGEMVTFQATAAGGVFVLELEQSTWRDVVRQLDAVERNGVGQRRDQGYGQVVCFDPHFLISSQNG
jgi:CRISPR-associated protein Csx10